MSDQCKHCTLRGNIGICVQEECYTHESWFVDELLKIIAKAGCNNALLQQHYSGLSRFFCAK